MENKEIGYIELKDSIHGQIYILIKCDVSLYNKCKNPLRNSPLIDRGQRVVLI